MYSNDFNLFSWNTDNTTTLSPDILEGEKLKTSVLLNQPTVTHNSVAIHISTNHNLVPFLLVLLE